MAFTLYRALQCSLEIDLGICDLVVLLNINDQVSNVISEHEAVDHFGCLSNISSGLNFAGFSHNNGTLQSGSCMKL